MRLEATKYVWKPERPSIDQMEKKQITNSTTVHKEESRHDNITISSISLNVCLHFPQHNTHTAVTYNYLSLILTFQSDTNSFTFIST